MKSRKKARNEKASFRNLIFLREAAFLLKLAMITIAVIQNKANKGNKYKPTPKFREEKVKLKSNFLTIPHF
jgi:hypothetical protein